MRIDVHNHAIPETALELLRRDPGYGVTIDAERWIGGSNPPSFELAPSFVDPQAKCAELSANDLEGAVISCAPPLFFYHVSTAKGEAVAQATNQGLEEMCRCRPAELRWMATVPLQDVDRAIAVLDDAAARGCVGVQLGTATPSRRLDDLQFEPWWDAVEYHGFAVMLHPAYNEKNRSLESYYLQNVIGNQLETTVAIERLICAGVLDRHPRLRFVLVHAGGYFPWQAGRLRHASGTRPELEGSPPDPWDYLDRLWFDVITHDQGVLSCLIDRVGSDRVLMGTDLPFDMALADPMRQLVQVAGPDSARTIAEQNPAALYGRAHSTPV